MLSPEQHAAAKVRGLIAERQTRQSDVAAVLGMTQPSLSRRLACKRSFTLTELASLAAHFEVPIATFLPAEAAAAS